MVLFVCLIATEIWINYELFIKRLFIGLETIERDVMYRYTSELPAKFNFLSILNRKYYGHLLYINNIQDDGQTIGNMIPQIIA